MKTFLALFMGALIGCTIAGVLVARHISERSASEIAKREAAWLVEKSSLESALRDAKNQPQTIVERRVEVEKKPSPSQIIETLQGIRIVAGDVKSTRHLLQQLENLREAGRPALPAIQGFLSRNEDVDYDSPLNSWRVSRDGKIQTEFVCPPSLRFGLLDIAKQIGGAQAEKLLAETLSITGRGAEVAYLTRILQEIAPFKYRDMALSVARDLLAHPAIYGQTGGLDRYDRNYLYGVLEIYNDVSFAAQAQSELIGADGQIDRAALKYLQQSLGEKSLSVVAEAYKDSRIMDPAKKEPLARLALNFAGANPQADELYRAAINDPGLPVDSRRELIEDLNQDGFENRKNPTARDLELIKNRLDLINRYRNDVDHKIITGAFNEAEKDLRNMLTKYGNNASQ